MLNSKNISSIFVLHILIVCINSALNDRPLDIFHRLNEIDHGKELDWLIQDILKQVHKDLTCLAIIWDVSFKNIFSEDLFLKLRIKTVLKVLVKESEDLLSPNYDSVKVVKEIRRAGCNIYLLLLTNGDQASRFLRFADRHRLIDTRAKFLMVYDHRLFHNQLHYLWKKIVNIIFIRRYKESSRYELSTVPFPVPIKGMLIPRRVDTWRAGKFQTNTNLYREKTKELDGQILRAVVIQHVPSAIKMVDKPTPNDIIVEGYKPIGFGGLEIEVLNSLKLAMNFKSLVYEPPNSETEAWGQMQLNGSYSGLLGEMCNGHADFALGSLHYTPYHLDLLDLSVPYATECLTFLTPEALTDNSWKTLILPFRLNMWIGIIVTFVFGAGFFYVFANVYNSLNKNQVINHPNKNTKTTSSRKIKIKQMFNIKDFKLMLKRKFPFSSLKFWNKNKSKNINSVQIYTKPNIHFNNNVKNLPTFKLEGMFLFDSFNNSLLYTYGMIALVSLPKFPSGWALRIMTGCWWIYCILIVVSYRASLTAILATPQPRVSINTVEELALSPIKCGGWGEQNKQFFTTSLDPASREIGKKFEIIKDPGAKDAISRIAKGTFSYYGNIYFLRSLIVKQGFLLQLPTENNVSVRESGNVKDQEKRTTSNHNLHIMSDCVINMPISIGLQKNSPLKPQVDKYIRLFIEAGLVKKWLNDVITDTFITEEPLSQEEIKALVDLRKLNAGFIALFTGYLISIIVLLAENIHWFFIVKKDPLFDKYYLSKYYKKELIH